VAALRAKLQKIGKKKQKEKQAPSAATAAARLPASVPAAAAYAPAASPASPASLASLASPSPSVRSQLAASQATLRRLYQASIMNGANGGPLPSKSEVINGTPEEGSWLEADYTARMRCARNHVRRLLRGRVWYEAQLLSAKVKKAKTAKKESGRGFFGRLRGSKVSNEESSDGGGGFDGAGAVENSTETKPEVLVQFKTNRRAPLEGEKLSPPNLGLATGMHASPGRPPPSHLSSFRRSRSLSPSPAPPLFLCQGRNLSSTRSASRWPACSLFGSA
jgi:hypothetical protein